MVFLHTVSLIVESMSTVVLLVLFSIYLKNYKAMKSQFSLGLLVFSGFFIISNVAAIAMSLYNWPLYEMRILTQHILPLEIIELIGFVVLLWVTWR